MKWFKCILCNELKSSLYFYRDKHKKSGFKPRCKVCDKLSLNKENRRKYEYEYRKKYPEKRKKIVSLSYQKNKQHHKKVQAIYRKTEAFRYKHRTNCANSRAKSKSAFIESIDYMKFFYESDRLCFYCKKSLTEKKFEIDHFIPYSKGGKHEKSNLKISCSFCNKSKGSKHPSSLGGSYQMV